MTSCFNRLFRVCLLLASLSLCIGENDKSCIIDTEKKVIAVCALKEPTPFSIEVNNKTFNLNFAYPADRLVQDRIGIELSVGDCVIQVNVSNYPPDATENQRRVFTAMTGHNNRSDVYPSLTLAGNESSLTFIGGDRPIYTQECAFDFTHRSGGKFGLNFNVQFSQNDKDLAIQFENSTKFVDGAEDTAKGQESDGKPNWLIYVYIASGFVLLLIVIALITVIVCCCVPSLRPPCFRRKSKKVSTKVEAGDSLTSVGAQNESTNVTSNAPETPIDLVVLVQGSDAKTDTNKKVEESKVPENKDEKQSEPEKKPIADKGSTLESSADRKRKKDELTQNRNQLKECPCIIVTGELCDNCRFAAQKTVSVDQASPSVMGSAYDLVRAKEATTMADISTVAKTAKSPSKKKTKKTFSFVN